MGFVPPGDPPLALMASKELQVRARRTPFDEVVLLVRLARVLALTSLDHVDLRPAGRQCPQTSTNSEKDGLRHVPEVEADAATVRPAVLPSLGPDEVGYVAETPCLHDTKPFW